MAGEENYKEFDTSSIVSRDTVSLGKITLKKREAFLAIIALIALVIVIILAIVLAVEVGGKSSSSCPATSSAITGQTKSAVDDFCITTPCLKTAAYEKSIMNESVNPCQNFYQFACGGYADVYPSTPLISDQRPFTQIRSYNLQRLVELLNFQPERTDEHSYERKLIHFMQSCSNHFDKMSLRGVPLIEKVIKPFGGWYVLGQWDVSKFDFHNQLKIVHVDFWTPAFFSISLATDTTDWNKKILQMDSGGLGLPIYVYDERFDFQIHQMYKNYMMNLAYLISSDASVKVDIDKIYQFADDAHEVEWMLAGALKNLPLQEDPHHYSNRINLGSLTELTENTIDFVDYFKSAFPPVSGTFSNSTQVAVLIERYFHNLGPLLKNYTSSDDGKRKLHNYLMWQLIHRYAQDLSWEYVHAKRQLNFFIYGSKDDSSGYSYCFRVAERTMREAMGAVFVKNYLNQKDKQEAVDMVGLIRDELVQRITTSTWMSSDNKEASIKKIKESIYKIGYPDYMTNDTYMDSLYSKIVINDTDYFGNILNFNIALKQRFSDSIAKPDSKALWVYHIMDPRVEYYNPWHEFIMTVAALQNPLFAHNGPAYYNYGGIGTLLATNLIHAVDEYGSYYKLDNSNYGNWWTTSTSQGYKEIKECAKGAQNSSYSRSEISLFGGFDTSHVEIFALELLSDAGGLSMSYKAYTAKMAKAGSEKPPAGFSNYTVEQLFFIAFAQTNCQNTPAHLKELQLMEYRFPGDYKVNMAVSQNKDFRMAFGCVNGDPMAPQNTCQLF